MAKLSRRSFLHSIRPTACNVFSAFERSACVAATAAFVAAPFVCTRRPVTTAPTTEASPSSGAAGSTFLPLGTTIGGPRSAATVGLSALPAAAEPRGSSELVARSGSGASASCMSTSLLASVASALFSVSSKVLKSFRGDK